MKVSAPVGLGKPRILSIPGTSQHNLLSAVQKPLTSLLSLFACLRYRAQPILVGRTDISWLGEVFVKYQASYVSHKRFLVRGLFL